ncbi:MAG: tRNA (N6-threonylcarbamoyladenosine(37)-N6)-methyltransferase TrmO [Gammaproteobacteria bacterium]|nr:MAG: tRNA (N6-threonylcarbamoyladenosine(37)-N6)-methyltransferase TrmO [Gammaproteobacteria bacterium]
MNSKASNNISEQKFQFSPIGIIQSPYQEKFAIPRQPGLVSAAKGQILLQNEANNSELLRGIEQFSHLWLIFVFHGTLAQGWKPLVRPPRLGGNEKMGVLATRSTFRPNPIGISVVTLDSVETYLEAKKQQAILHISGLDLLNGTPILDIKPYIPYSDSLADAQAGFAQQAPQASLVVKFSTIAMKQLNELQQHYFDLKLLINQVLAQDPRPAYKQGKVDNKIYGMALYDLNIQWQMYSLEQIEVLKISQHNVHQ